MLAARVPGALRHPRARAPPLGGRGDRRRRARRAADAGLEPPAPRHQQPDHRRLRGADRAARLLQLRLPGDPDLRGMGRGRDARRGHRRPGARPRAGGAGGRPAARGGAAARRGREPARARAARARTPAAWCGGSGAASCTGRSGRRSVVAPPCRASPGTPRRSGPPTTSSRTPARWSRPAGRPGAGKRPSRLCAMVQQTVRVATVNVNGVRAAFRKGMGAWLDGRGVDILALQEVRAVDGGPGGAARPRVGRAARRRDREGALRRRPRVTRRRSRAPRRDPPRLDRRRGLRHRRALDRGGLRRRRRDPHGGVRVRALGRGRHPEAGREDPLPRRHRGAAARARGPQPARGGGRRPERRAPQPRHQELEGQPEELGLPAGGARLLGPIRRRGGRRPTTTRAAGWAGSTSGAARPARSPGRTPGGRGAGRRSRTTPGGGSTTTSPPPRSAERVDAVAVDRAATRDERWSDHTPVVVDYRVG